MRNRNKEKSMRSCRSRRGGILVGLLVAGAVLMCVVIAVAFSVARNVQVRTAERIDGNDVSIDTPVGHLSVHAHENGGWAASDVPVYPGARSTKNHDGGGAVVEWTSNNGHNDGGFSVAASEMVTPDSADKVIDFYRSQLPDWAIVNERDGAVRFELKESGHKRIIGIHARHDGTHIGVASIGEPASN